MKIRNGFVSNSSSSSFIIRTDRISKKQMKDLFEFFDSIDERDGYEVPDVTLNENAGILHIYYADTYGGECKEKMLSLGLKEEDIFWSN